MSAMLGRAGVQERDWKAPSALVGCYRHWASVYMATVSETSCIPRAFPVSPAVFLQPASAAGIMMNSSQQVKTLGLSVAVTHQHRTACRGKRRALGLSVRLSHTGSVASPTMPQHTTQAVDCRKSVARTHNELKQISNSFRNF